MELTSESPFFTDTSYQVSIEEFEGPLDLLLHLIKKNEVDIYNIPIAAITRQYLDYLDLMKELNLDIAGEFLVMAATLLQIKSRMLLPVTVEEAGEEEEEDPREELVRRLLEYQKYKEAAITLAQRDLLGRDFFARKFHAPELASFASEEEPVDVEMFELIKAFQGVLARVSPETFHDVGADGPSIADRITEILALLKEEAVTFESLFANDFTRDALVTTFLAVLELCKLRMIRITQLQERGTIWIMPVVAADDDEIMKEENDNVG